ncbi:MAG: amidohydrolase [Caldisphaeraceae archaeon]|nr:amidohydrolase [Caldisphaeraceae archaeon]
MKSVSCFVNGRIYKSFKPVKVADSMVVFNDRILYVGEESTAKEICKALKGKTIDLRNKVVFPGFIDCHMHLDELGIYLNTLDLRGTKSIEELKDKVRNYATKTNLSWIIGHGWDQELFKEKRWPTRWDIDDAVKDKPALLSRIDLHAAVLNSRAIEAINLLDRKLMGIERDRKGNLTGIVKEDAFQFVVEKVKESLDKKEYANILQDALSFAASQGVTTVGFVSCDRRSLNTLLSIKEKKIRVRVYLNLQDAQEKRLHADNLEILEDIGIKKGFGDERVKINGIKILSDGSLGSRTAWLSRPYSDDPSTSGFPNIKEEELRMVAKKVHEAGLQLAIHGIGDRAIDMILNVYEDLQSPNKLRHRIEHASILREDQVERISRLGIVVSIQPRFVLSDWWAKERVGEERVRWIYPFKTIISKGIEVGLSTDAPVEKLNPFETIYAAITRGKYENVPFYNETKDQTLSLEEALYAYTMGSAYVLHEEKDLGSLEEGKLADFIIIDRDPFEINEKHIKKIKVLETYVGGSNA